jgi:acyl-CoA synthetase (AMP-forming)/AMP-acid ligase II
MIGKHNYSDKVMSTSAAEKISLVTGKYFVVKPCYHVTGIQHGVRSDWLSATLSAFIARLTEEPSHLQNNLFAQTLRYAQNFILGISIICLW